MDEGDVEKFVVHTHVSLVVSYINVSRKKGFQTRFIHK